LSERIALNESTNPNYYAGLLDRFRSNSDNGELANDMIPLGIKNFVNTVA